jgi:DNA-directed RNA polymerase subunit M/transcription elongation factor TFIIS
MLLIFLCRKCGHEITLRPEQLEKLVQTDCPSCGEESYNNWILHSAEGDNVIHISVDDVVCVED